MTICLLRSHNPWGLAGGGLPPWIVVTPLHYRRISKMVLGKRWSTSSYLKKNLSGKTISTSSYQQAKQVSTVFFPLSETNVVVVPRMFPKSGHFFDSRMIREGALGCTRDRGTTDTLGGTTLSAFHPLCCAAMQCRKRCRMMRAMV